MEKKSIQLLIVILVLIGIIIGWFVFQIPRLSPETKTSCLTYKEYSNDAINLVFFGKESQVKEYSEVLFSISPFKEAENQFNIYYIDENRECKFYKDIALYCYSRNLITSSDVCPNDYIIVLESEDQKIRSSSYLNVLSINTNSPKIVIAHEFAHAFANLAEEYTPAKIPAKSKNCVKTCSEFGNNNGCFQGCSDSSYYRSIESGIMRSLYSDSFGEFNSLLIKSLIEKKKKGTIIGNAISTQTECANSEYYLITGDYSNRVLKIKDKQIESGCSGNNGLGAFSVKILDLNNNSLADESFNPELIFTDSQIEENEITGETYTFEGEFYLKIPILENAKTLEIYYNEEKIEQTSLENLEWRPCKIE